MEKNRLEKVRNHVFYKHTNIVIKNGGKKREKNLKKLSIRVSKNCWKINRLEKVRKHVFFHTNIVTKNRGKKTREKKFKKHE